jgi:hypothetical protein
VLTRNKRITPAHASAAGTRRGRKAPATLAIGLGVLGLVAAAMVPQQASAKGNWVRAATTSSSVDRTVKDPDITESSGLARSGYSTSRLWTHNDSGGGTYIYALASDGSTAATFNLGDASHKDWEAMASYQSGSSSYLYIGDIGDNGKKRDSIFVHRVVEPSLSSTGGTLKPETFEFRYPDGKHNAEAMMVAPGTHRVYIVTKSSPAAIYVAPTTLSSTHINVLTKVTSAPVGLSDAVFLDDGRFVLRGYVSGWLYKGFGSTPIRFPLPLKGESVTAGYNSSYIYIGSEHQYSKIYRVSLP